MSLYNVISKPIVTEKTSIMEVAGLKAKYTVEVSSDATKIDIKNAFKAIYGVTVESVNILNTREKFKMTKKGIGFKRRVTKKAYVTLKEGQKVDFLEIK